MQQRLQIARNLVTAPAPGVHGRADRRPRRLGAGAAARPDARPGARARPVGRRRHARSRGGAAAGAPHAGDAGAARSSKPGSPTRCSTIRSTPTRSCWSASVLHAVTVQPADAAIEGLRQDVHAAHQGGARAAGARRRDLSVRPASAWRWPAPRARARARCCASSTATTGRRPAGSASASGRDGRHRGCDAARVLEVRRRPSATCQPVPARHPARAGARRRGRAAPCARRGARRGARARRRDARAAAIPERLWGLSPATFSGGEQQRVNIARGCRPATRSCCSTSRPPRSTPGTVRGSSI